MRASHRITFIVGCCAALGVCQPAWATIDNQKSYKQAYPGKEPRAYSCKVCHEGAVGKATDLNGYGKALQQLPAPANPKKLTAEDYKAAEVADPDGDGATTANELEAGTDPSDAASVPPVTGDAPHAAEDAPAAVAPAPDLTSPEQAQPQE